MTWDKVPRSSLWRLRANYCSKFRDFCDVSIREMYSWRGNEEFVNTSVFENDLRCVIGDFWRIYLFSKANNSKKKFLKSPGIHLCKQNSLKIFSLLPWSLRNFHKFERSNLNYTWEFINCYSLITINTKISDLM